MTTSSAVSSLAEVFRTATKDTASDEIQFKSGQYTKSGTKSSGLMGLFKAFFRTEEERRKNRETIEAVKKAVGEIFTNNSNAFELFNKAFDSKLYSGSPLTKGALLRFKDSLPQEEQKKLEILIAQAKTEAKEGITPAEQALINAQQCWEKAGEITNSVEESSYWKRARDCYDNQNRALERGDQEKATQWHEIAKGYREAATTYGGGEKDLAHYLGEVMELYRAEIITLQQKDNGWKDDIKRYRILRACYSEAIKAEQEGKSDIAQYWSKAAKCLEAAQRAEWNRHPEDYDLLMEAFKIYRDAAKGQPNTQHITAADNFIKSYWKEGKDNRIFDHYFERKNSS